MIENENDEPLSVGRKTRVIPPAMRRALKSRDEGCRFPGCTFHTYVDAHHVEHWADGGETKLSNLITLCRAHHRMVHKGERMDYDMALVCFFGQRDRHRERQRECQLQSSEHVSAETSRTAH
jgi:HNH endonuclease